MGFELGLYLPCNHPDPQSDQSHIYAEILEQAKFAEEIGFAGFAIPEHHFQEGLVVPSSLMMAVKVASITRSARVRTAVIPLPIHHPLRLAGEIALADQLTEGRLEVGLARGSFEYTFRRFKMTMDQSRDRFLESMTVLERLLTETDVTFAGEYIQIQEPTTIMPRPRQQPRPPSGSAGFPRTASAGRYRGATASSPPRCASRWSCCENKASGFTARWRAARRSLMGRHPGFSC